jgi:hypothetical protein
MNLMDPEGMWGCDFGETGPKTGMAFNKAFGGKKASELKSPDSDILVFETKTQAMNQALDYVALPYAESPKIMGQERGWNVVTWGLGTKSVSEDGSLRDTEREMGVSAGTDSQ